MKIIKNNYIPFKSFNAMNVFGVLFCRKNVKITPEIINHERIHTAQMKETLFIGFYLLYVIEWFFRLPFGSAYHKISFEREAYINQKNLNYLKKRRKYQWVKFLFNKNYS